MFPSIRDVAIPVNDKILFLDIVLGLPYTGWMIYYSLNQCLDLARRAHEGQTDKHGIPLFQHILLTWYNGV